MSGILSFNEIMDEDFKQASVYVDACFCLAYIDPLDSRGDKVAEIIDKWSSENVECVYISNHVMSEIVNNLFKSNILYILELYHTNT
jgi:signal-transduction protein with cAMP-binding, CBS, and nucleotidyltransferase domain